jgi:anaerobic ribonucleoside-triphosphate reductase
MTKENQLRHINEQIGNIGDKMKNIERLKPEEGGCKDTSSTYSRISGYYRNIGNWNFGKKQEFEERLEYNLA